ncbi:Maf-like protein [Legionella rubrilucens]|uniref:Nucleoside triphosphate pyrophosphatase n=1 Tax=Legionella rubrilucens TaxID=458 RepID=A0A0W0XVJ2_9GAMM|nr:nucleoside triphosphate pyrophosphatase [Legionella rubrilucens]KTD48553.1 Maf-like protein [Legionella rubrilucens]
MSELLTQQPLILASSSMSRQQLLQSLGLQFAVIPSHCNEEQIKKLSSQSSHSELAATLAASKALMVSEDHPEHFVIGADQLCVLKDKSFDKPENHETAVTQLRRLRGKTHQQISACCLAKEGQIVWAAQDIAFLTMRNLSDRTIEAYLLSDQPYQSCGAYHYEGLGKWLFSDVRGSDSTIMGLPLQPLIEALLQHRIITF